ncbi:MAG: MFS transporter, partial [Janthinobacterium lividum]
RELGLTATDLGTLTSLYFLGFAGAQIPAGVLLDRYGARRVTALMMLAAAIGATLVGLAPGLGAMMLGRLLIGVGVSVCLGGALKAMAQSFAVERLPFINGLVMAIGGLGGVAVGLPLAGLLHIAGWRVVSIGLAVLTLAVASALWLGARDAVGAHAPPQATLREQFQGTLQVMRSPVFWKLGTFSAISQGVFYAMQSLWVGAFLRDVPATGGNGASPASLISIIGIAFVIGNVLLGSLARLLQRRGISVEAFCGGAMAVFIIVQIAIITRLPLPPWLVWAAYGAFGGSGILTYAILAGHFPQHLIGRVNTSFTLMIFLLIFVFQIAIGAALGAWPLQGEHYPIAAHAVVWIVLIVLQGLSGIWYFRGARRVRPE